MWTGNKKGKIHSIGENWNKLNKKNHFLAVCKFKKKNVEGVEEKETNTEVFSVKKQRQERREYWTKGKIHYTKG